MAKRLQTDAEWIQWGEADPLFGVATWPGKEKGEQGWTDTEFYDLGRCDWNDFSREWRSYGMRTGTCVEIGCGAGRITFQLAREFAVVQAFDVAPGMLAYAQKRNTASNIRFTQIEGISIPLPNGSVDAVFSTHVLQHMDSQEIGFDYFRECFRVMAADATLMIHLPIFKWPGSANKYGKLQRALDTYSNLLAHARRARHGMGMRTTHYEFDRLFSELTAIGFRDIQIRTVCPASDKNPHPFVFARR